MTERQRLSEWIAMLDDTYVACLIEVAAVLFADQCGVDIGAWTDCD
jgi:hypothetical protein